MNNYENNAFFWQKIDTLFLSSKVEIARKKGEVHPEYKNLIYPVNYGHLSDTVSASEGGISVYVGSQREMVTSIIVAADILKKDVDVKILVGCTEEEAEDVLRFLNQTDYQKTVMIRRGADIPSWGVTDN